MALWDRIERTLAGLFGFCALAVGLYQVFSRYIDPRLAVGWGDEVVVYFTVWAIFIIASQLVRTDGHVRPDIVLRLMKRSEEHTSELQSHSDLVCRLLLEKKKIEYSIL